MINVLEFNGSHEYKFAWNMSARTMFYIFENLERCMLLYRYKLAYGSPAPFFWQKFGTSSPTKIKFDKLIGDNLMIFHLDIYRESTVELADLLDYCEQKGIDVFIPLVDMSAPRKLGYDDSHLILIKDILDRYDTSRFDFTKLNYKNSDEIDMSIIESCKPLIRSLNIKRLLG